LRVALRFVALRFVALRFVALRFTVLRLVALRFVALRFVGRRFDTVFFLTALRFAGFLRRAGFFFFLKDLAMMFGSWVVNCAVNGCSQT